jgi:hypothetical protein
MKSRVPVFHDLLRSFRDADYSFMTVKQVAASLQAGHSLPDKLAVIRCDVDSDVRTSLLMLEAALQENVVISWYWRLSTLNSAAMLQVAQAGHENGYHFEEVATVAKRNGARTNQDIDRLLPEIRDAFCRNIEDKYAQAAGSLPMTVASHGDFANRLLKLSNSILLDTTIRRKYGIVADITGDVWMYPAPISRCYSDVEAPRWWEPSLPLIAPPSTLDLIYILVHPRQYHARIIENTYLDIERAVEGATYAVRRRFSGLKDSIS